MGQRQYLLAELNFSENYLHHDECSLIQYLIMEEPEVFDNFFDEFESGSYELMCVLQDLQLGKDVMEEELEGFECFKLCAYFYGFFNSFKEGNFLVLLDCLRVELFNVFEFAIECSEPIEGGVVDNIWSDEQLSE